MNDYELPSYDEVVATLSTTDIDELRAADFLLLEKRYDKPTAGWVFITLRPDEIGAEMDAADPALSDEARQYIADHPDYISNVIGWMESEWKDHLVTYATTQCDFKLSCYGVNALPEDMRSYVGNCIIPLEWKGDDEWKTRVQVFTKSVEAYARRISAAS
jgi:hypothetical protein